MPRRAFPYPPRQSSGFWSVRLPPSARIGEVRVFIGSNLPPPDPSDQPPLAGQGSAALTAVVPAAWIISDGAGFEVPPNSQWTAKILSRCKPGYTWPADPEVTDFGFFGTSDVAPFEGTYVTGSANNTSGPWNYFAPGSTTSDGTVLTADACALYITVKSGTKAQRYGPGPAIQAASGAFATYVHTTRAGDANTANIEICSIGDTTGPPPGLGTWHWQYRQRVDAMATHTRPLYPPPVTGV